MINDSDNKRAAESKQTNKEEIINRESKQEPEKKDGKQKTDKNDGKQKTDKNEDTPSGAVKEKKSEQILPPPKKRHRLPGEKRNKRITLLVSIVAAIVCWAFVVQTENPTIQLTMSDIPVTFVNQDYLSENNLAVSGQNDYTVKVVIEGKRGDVIEVKKSDVQVTGDLAGLQKGDNSVPLVATVSGNNVKVANVVPLSVTMSIDEMISVPKKVVIEYTGMLPTNRIIASALAEPSTINVTGPSSEVDRIESLKATVSYDQVLSEDGPIDVKIVPYTSEDASISNTTVEENSVKVRFSVYAVKSVPLKVNITGQLPELYKLDDTILPDTIKIQGPPSELSKIESVESEPIDISTLKVSTRVKIVPILPEGVSIAADSGSGVAQFTITQYDTKTFNIISDNIKLENVPEIYAVTVAPAVVISLTAAGDTDILEELQESDFTISADCTNVDENITSLELSAKCSEDGVENVTVSPKAIEITVTRKEQS